MQLSYESAKKMAGINPNISSDGVAHPAQNPRVLPPLNGRTEQIVGQDDLRMATETLETAQARQAPQVQQPENPEKPEKSQKPQPEKSQKPQLEEDRRALMSFALRHLARREHSRVELRRKLVSRGAADGLVDAIIEGLTADGSLSDRRFAAEYVRSRIRKGYGPIRIRMDLIERGINDQLAEEQLTQPADFWHQRATEVCNKKFDATKPAGEESADAQQQRWNRCARFLSQRGFPADLIYQTLDGRIAD